jgi:tetratricopeptide (TPR) repeat protein
MPQKDDMLARLSLELTAVVGDATRLGDQGHFAAAEALLEAAYRRHTGSQGLLLRSLGAGDLLALFGAGGSLDAGTLEVATLDVERCLAVAELLYADAALRVARGDAPTAAEFGKLGQLYGALLEADATLLTALSSRLQALLPHGPLPPALLRRLVTLYTRAGRYAEAENWLFRLLADSPGDVAVARAFYEGLLVLPDDALEAGGLPRGEVYEGLSELAGMEGEVGAP